MNFSLFFSDGQVSVVNLLLKLIQTLVYHVLSLQELRVTLYFLQSLRH